MDEKKLQKSLDELVMLFAVFVKRGIPQTTLIKELGSVGFEPKRIAEILGTTPNTVRVTLHNIKKNK